MNVINDIAKSSNHEQYLNRMDSSYMHTSKKLIPLYLYGNKIIDVGCGSGILIRQILQIDPTIDIMGIDVNEKSVDFCTNQGLNVRNAVLDDLNEKFDTIIFSSVLHEFSSYAENQVRFTVLPILTALQKAYYLLNPNGVIIIRDGIKGNEELTTIKAKSLAEINAFNTYIKDNPIYNDPQYDVDGLYITAYENILKEFLFTYTWGPESYSREVQEQYGILTVDEWKKLVKRCEFNLISTTVSSEEYAKYLANSFNQKELDKIFEQSTILLVARK